MSEETVKDANLEAAKLEDGVDKYVKKIENSVSAHTMLELMVDGLYFRQNISPETMECMRVYRKACIEAAKLLIDIEVQTEASRELALAFKGIEEAIQYGIKHLCLTDPKATKEII